VFCVLGLFARHWWERSQPHGIYAFPVGAGKGGDAGVGLAEEDSTAQTAAGDDFAALRGGEGAGGGGCHEQGLHATILVANHAAVGVVCSVVMVRQPAAWTSAGVGQKKPPFSSWFWMSG